MTNFDDRPKWVRGFYDERASKYDDSWHPTFAKVLLSHAKPESGDHILDLACGTGLVTLPAIDAVGSSGKVVGIDLSSLMLAETRKKIAALDQAQQAVSTIVEHDITRLANISELEGLESSFDAITCCSALVLLEDPKGALREWCRFLKPGTGRLVVDVTHQHNQRNGIVIEMAMRKLGMAVPYHRSWCQSEQDFRRMLESAGLVVDDISFVEQVGFGRRLLGSTVDDATAAFEQVLGFLKWTNLANEDPKKFEKIQDAFIKEWQDSANEDGKVEEVDGSYIAVAHRPRT